MNEKIKDIYNHFYENYALNLKDFENKRYIRMDILHNNSSSISIII